MTGTHKLRAVLATTLVVLAVLVVSIPVASATFSSATPSASNSWATAAVFPRWVDVAVGIDHGCAVDRWGEVWCWGSGQDGKNGESVYANLLAPKQVTGGTANFVTVGAGQHHTCAVAADGDAWCWGANWNGQLGNGTTTLSASPRKVTFATDPSPVLVAITVGTLHTCALDDTGRAWCWGNNGSGQVGNTTATDLTRPVEVATLGATVSSISAGADHTCAVSTYIGDEPRAYCWGQRNNGRIGDGFASGTAPTPVAVSTTGTRMPGAIATVTAGQAHSCATQTTGRAWCWGAGADGRLGDGGTLDRSVPSAVAPTLGGSTPLSFDGIEAGVATTCAFEGSGKPWCWGRAGEGQLGEGTSTTVVQRLEPRAVVTVSMTEAVSSLAAGQWVNCALARGDLWCWGKNDHGRLGSGAESTVYDTPRRIPD